MNITKTVDPLKICGPVHVISANVIKYLINKLLKFIRQQLYLQKLPTTSATSHITEISKSPYSV